MKKRESVITLFEIYCGDKVLTLTRYQSLIFIMDSTVSYIVIVLTDVWGRKFGFQVMAVMYVFAPLLGSFTLNFEVVCLSIVFFFIGQDILYQLTYIYYNEIASNNLRSKISIIGTYYSFGNIFINYILIFIPDY